jgi:hypothetical protein
MGREIESLQGIFLYKKENLNFFSLVVNPGEADFLFRPEPPLVRFKVELPSPGVDVMISAYFRRLSPIFGNKIGFFLEN